METSVADMESISTTSGTHKNYLKILNLTDNHAKCLFNWYFNNYCSELRDTTYIYRQSLDGKQIRPNRCPDTINIRAGKGIDG